MTAEQRIPVRPFGREPIRAIPEGHTRPVQYRWPSQAHLVPITCGHCGVRLLRNDLPTAEHPLVDLTCWCCSREACELLLESSIRPERPPLTGEDLAPKRERPSAADRERNRLKVRAWRQKAKSAKRWAEKFDRCVRCGTTEIPHNGQGYCQSCKNHYYRAAARVRQQQSRERKAAQA